LYNVMALPTGQEKAQGIAQGNPHSHGFWCYTCPGCAPAPGWLAHRFFEAQAAHGWARTTVLSRMRFSISGSSVKW
jgi:hypothetical protein